MTGLASNELTETGFAFDDAVGNVHLSAEGREEYNDLNWVDIMSDNDELSLFPLNKVDDPVDALSENSWPWGRLVGFTSSSSFSPSNEPLFLLLFVFRGVFAGEFEELSGGLLVQGLVELVQSWGNLEPLLDDGSLPLEFDVFGPSDESGEIPFRLDVTTDTEITRAFDKEGVLLVDLFGSGFSGRSGDSLAFSDHGFFCKFDLRL